MKIALVYLSNNFGEIFPVGLLSIASMLNHKYPQHGVEIVDANFDDPLQKIIGSEYDMIGISSMTVEYERASMLAREIKRRFSTPVILGGVHISLLPSSLRECFDIGVLGEGEEVFCELVQIYETKRIFLHEDLIDIKGLVYRHNGNLITTPRRDCLESLDMIPKYDYSLVNPGYFRMRPLIVWAAFGKEAIMLTSRGCPYKCVFCSTTQFWKKARFLSVERIIAEMQDLVENYGATHILLWDDLFTVNKIRLRKLAQEFRNSGLHTKVKLSCQSRANLVDDELCEVLTSLNIRVVSFGFESGNARVLKYLKGGSVTVEQNTRAIETCVRHGLKPVGSLIFGSPTETLAEMEETINFIDKARKLGAYSIWIFVMTPFPATQIWEIAKSRGKVSEEMNFDLLDHSAVYNPLLLDEGIDRGEFRRLFFRCRRHLFHFRIKKVFDLLKNNPVRTIRLVVFSLLPQIRKLIKMHQVKKIEASH